MFIHIFIGLSTYIQVTTHICRIIVVFRLHIGQVKNSISFLEKTRTHEFSIILSTKESILMVVK